MTAQHTHSRAEMSLATYVGCDDYVFRFTGYLYIIFFATHNFELGCKHTIKFTKTMISSHLIII